MYMVRFCKEVELFGKLDSQRSSRRASATDQQSIGGLGRVGGHVQPQSIARLEDALADGGHSTSKRGGVFEGDVAGDLHRCRQGRNDVLGERAILDIAGVSAVDEAGNAIALLPLGRVGLLDSARVVDTNHASLLRHAKRDMFPVGGIESDRDDLDNDSVGANLRQRPVGDQAHLLGLSVDDGFHGGRRESKRDNDNDKQNRERTKHF